MFVILVLSCLASSYGQRPATEAFNFSLSSSKSLSDLLESSFILYSAEDNGAMVLRDHNSSFVGDDGTISLYDQYFYNESTNQYSYSSPVAIQLLTDVEEYSSTDLYQPNQSSILQDIIHSSIVRSSLETSVTLESSLSSILHEQNVGTEDHATISLPATSNVQSSPEVLVPSVGPVTGKSSNDEGHSVDDILGSIIHLLGSSVKITRPETQRESHERVPAPARKNDRGPPKIYPSETPFVHPNSLSSEIYHDSFNSRSSISTTSAEYSTVITESSFTAAESVSIIPSFSLVENETSSSLNLILSSSYELTENTRSNELVTLTENILSSSPSILSHENTTEIQETQQELKPSVKDAIETTVETVENTGNNKVATLTKTVFDSSLSTPVNDRTTKVQKTMQELEPSTGHAIETTVEATEDPHIPTGPITDWVPLLDRTTLKRNPHSSVNNASELLIFTEPSIFNVTVSNNVGQSTATTDARIFPSDLSTGSNFSSTNSQPAGTIPSIINVHVTRPNENSDTAYSASAVNAASSRSNTRTESPNNQSELEPPDHGSPTGEAAEVDEVIVTLLGSGTLKSPPATTAPASPGSATGRPYVIPVDIEEVRPFIGAQIPTRPSSHGRPQFGGGNVQVAQAGINVADENGNKKGPSLSSSRPALVRPHRPRPTPPLIRIDTCIVGDDSTCDAKLNEYCKTDQGISSCQCRPGYSRTFARGPCLAVIKMLLSIRLDKLGDQRLVFNRNYLNPGSQEYQQLEYETRQAINSLFSYTPFARTFMGSSVNKFYSLGRKVIANSTILLDESMQTSNLKQKIRHEIVKAIASRNSNLGESKLYVDGSQNPIPAVEDLNECSDSNLNDCSSSGYCINAFATFRCACNPGFMDKYANEERKSGRFCTACAPDYCNNHGVCVINNGQRECKCRGNYIGAKCEIDGEVLGVALGASLAAMVIIVLTLVCLCVWNRRWKREQYKADMTSVPSMGGGYPNKTLSPINAYRLTIEDRVRWAHIADAMGNNYATAERPGRSLPTKQEREESYYGHPGRPRSRLCHNGTQPNGYYSPDYPPREPYHPTPNRFLTAGTVRGYYS